MTSIPDARPVGADALAAWPSHLHGIELVWHRLNREHDLRPFFRSSVRWAECDARLEPAGSVVASHTPGTRGDRPFTAWLADVAAHGRSAKVDMKEGGPVLDGVIATVRANPIPDRDVWFNCAADVIGGQHGFRALADAFPAARRSVPVDTLAPWLLTAPGPALDLLAHVRTWGVDRLSVSVQTPAFQEVVDVLSRYGWRTNVWDVSDDVQLREAIEASPTSITADLGVVDPPDPA